MMQCISQLGPKIAITFHTNDRAVVQTTLAPSPECKWLIPNDSPLTEAICWYMDAYVQKKELPPLPFELPELPPFTLRVVQLLQGVLQPITYQELAILSHQPNACRAVGNACHRNPLPLLLPCHRILGAGGKIGGFAFGKDVKLQLLTFEFPELAHRLH